MRLKPEKKRTGQKSIAMIIRFRSKDGQYRLSCEGDTPFQDVLSELVLTKLPPMDPQTLSVTMPGPDGGERSAGEVGTQTVDGLGLKNGDMLMLKYTASSGNEGGGQSISGKGSVPESVGISKVIDGSAASTSARAAAKQSALDDELDRDPGLIPRKRGPLCKHTDKGMCEYCSPLPPWDREYQADHNIKHLSFHAYVDELNAKVNKKEGGSSYIPPLKPSDFAINRRCPAGHEPWPKGICSKCQPSAITLQRQEFRMVDHVEFENSGMVNNFINAWRLSGVQRVGLLLGRYARYDKIPLGIKVQVEAIYEFPQVDREDGLVLQQWDDEHQVEALADELGLQPVGVIFSDLSDAGRGDGSVICKRHLRSFFLSSLEILFAVHWQLKYRNRCKWSETGAFSSKFVTCVVSGNSSGKIDINAYQAAESAEALVTADLVCASTHPDQMFIKPATPDRYVPDIFYQKINEYGLQVKHNAKPSFPVEFLLVSLTHGFPEKDTGLFRTTDATALAPSAFPVENREYLGDHADLRTLQTYFSCFHTPSNTDPDTFLAELSSFHVLFFLFCANSVLSDADRRVAVRAVRTQDPAVAVQLLDSDGFKTLQTLCRMA